MVAQFSFVSSQFTRLTDGQTDILLLAKTALHRFSAVKNIPNVYASEDAS